MATVRNRGNDATPIDKSQDNSRLAITPSDTLKQPVSWDAVYVGVGGTVRFGDGNGSATTITLAAGGPFFLGGTSWIYATGTTATGLVGVASKALR